MSRFSFRLQRVLDLREQKEQAISRQLTQAKHEADVALGMRDDLAMARESAAVAIHAQGARTAGELRAAGIALAHMDLHVDAATEAVVAAASEVETVQGHLTAAFQERRVLDRLKERALETWQNDMVQQDRQLMDAIALSRYGKRTGTTPTSNDPVQ